jgi:hypothetical protein
MISDEFTCPEWGEKSHGKAADGIFRKRERHRYCVRNPCRLYIVTGGNLFGAWYPALA